MNGVVVGGWEFVWAAYGLTFTAFAIAERSVFSMSRATARLVKRRMLRASPAFFPRMRSRTSPAFWAEVRMYLEVAFTSSIAPS